MRERERVKTGFESDTHPLSAVSDVTSRNTERFKTETSAQVPGLLTAQNSNETGRRYDNQGGFNVKCTCPH